MAIAMIAATALQGATPAYLPPSVFELLAGEWVCADEWLANGPTLRSETWQRDSEGRLTGVVTLDRRRAFNGESRQVAELVISGSGAARTLVYRPAGGAAIRYRLAREDRRQQEAVFESRRGGSPRTIGFRHDSFRRLTVTFGRADGSSERWSYQPPGMHTGIISCSGRRR